MNQKTSTTFFIDRAACYHPFVIWPADTSIRLDCTSKLAHVCASTLGHKQTAEEKQTAQEGQKRGEFECVCMRMRERERELGDIISSIG